MTKITEDSENVVLSLNQSGGQTALEINNGPTQVQFLDLGPPKVLMEFKPGKDGNGGDVNLYAHPLHVETGAPLEGYKHGVIRFFIGGKTVLELGQDSMIIQGREVKDDEVLEGLRAFVRACSSGVV